MSNDEPIRRVAIVGTGVIGASWAALFLAKGLEVAATDIAPDAETFGAAGFFALPMYYRGADEAHFVPLCPIVLTPKHWVEERPETDRDLKRYGARLLSILEAPLPPGVLVGPAGPDGRVDGVGVQGFPPAFRRGLLGGLYARKSGEERKQPEHTQGKPAGGHDGPPPEDWFVAGACYSPPVGFQTGSMEGEGHT